MAIDLFAAPFWIAFAIALFTLTPLKSVAGRKWLLAVINFALAGYYAGGFYLSDMSAGVKVKLVLVLAVGLFCAYATLRLLEKAQKRAAVAWGAGVLLFFLWLIYKLPALSHRVANDHLSPLLAAVGFSYFALRMVDVMRAVVEKRHPAPDIAQTINYLIPFHMLVAGPIQAYDEFVAQPGIPAALTFRETLAGADRVVTGMFKKYALAMTLDRLFLTGFRAHGAYLFFEAQIYYVWLYLDFSGYSDIAVGIGALLGVATPENFNRPFLARNVIDFWQRWHISLSQWIRRNLFLPLQVAFVRRTAGKYQLAAASVAFFVSFLLCGLWHNISARWLLWGALQALGLIACNAYQYALIKRYGRPWLRKHQAKPWLRVVSIAVTFEFAALTLAATMYPY